MTQEELIAAVKALQAKNGTDAEGLAVKLYDENFQLREKNRTAKAEIEELKKKLPAENAVVLAAADAKIWAEYQKLGKPEDLGKAVSERADLSKQVSESKRKELVNAAAEAHGLRASVLSKLIGELPIEMKDEQRDGKAVKVAYVKDGAESKPLDKYAESAWADFVPALRTEPAKGNGTQFVNQSTGGKAPESDPVKSYFAKTYGEGKKT